GAKVSISGENVASLKEKYGLDEAGLEEVLGKVEVVAPRIAGLEVLSDEEKKIVAFTSLIGEVMASRGYLDFINYLIGKGEPLEMIAREMLDWYEKKISTELRIRNLEITLETLCRLVSDLLL
ncbi:unnamed protein product, partial [marine sediment metagenome]